MAKILNLPSQQPQSTTDDPTRILHEIFTPEMAQVEKLLAEHITSYVTMIPEIGEHIVRAGGKRLRPLLTLATARLVEYTGDQHIRLAAAVEFMHTATLLHDDVVDDSETRRGQKTARRIWGNAASVLVGDFMLGQAFRMMVIAGSLDALDVLSDAAAVIAEGEVMQLATQRDINTTEDAYLAVITAKTATLFSAATKISAVIANRPSTEIDALVSYGRNLGIAFQLIDDALDYSGTQKTLGKNIGDDFREGKITLPLVLAYRRGNNKERNFWRTAIAKSTDEKTFQTAIKFMGKHNVLNDTVLRARHYGDMARDALAIFPQNNLHNQLIRLIDFCIERAY